MIRLALKNIWARKKRSGWLLAELVAVAVILCHLMDPLIVQTYVNCLPDGYEMDNLYRISFSSPFQKALKKSLSLVLPIVLY